VLSHFATILYSSTIIIANSFGISLVLSYLNPDPEVLLAELNQRMAPQFEKLNKALIELVSY